MRNRRRWYLVTTGLIIGAHALLGPDARAYTYLVAAVLTIPPIVGVLRRAAPGSRLPWWLLLAAMSVLSFGDALSACAGPAASAMVDMCITLGHATILASAVALAVRRGRNDIGGMLDMSVVAIGLAGVLWTVLLHPRLEQLHTAPGEQLALLVSVLVLAGVLGALLRLWLDDVRQRTLAHLLVALVVSLIGNIVMIYTTGAVATGRGAAIELLFMAAYAFVGLAMLEPSVFHLMNPGRPSVDVLSIGRLALLGLVLAANPVAGGIFEMIGKGADGPLLAAGSLLITPLALVRVGRLARQRQQAEQRLRHQATHDLLTGLPNRAELLTRLGTALQRETIAGRPAVVLLFCDLNGFKQVNDRLGHEAGDQLLTEVAARVRAGLRGSDTLARYGGDEFLLLCADPADQQAAAVRLTGHVERALATPFDLAGERVSIGASIGTALSRGDLGSDELISRADQDMYRAKQVRGERAAAGHR